MRKIKTQLSISVIAQQIMLQLFFARYCDCKMQHDFSWSVYCLISNERILMLTQVYYVILLLCTVIYLRKQQPLQPG